MSTRVEISNAAEFLRALESGDIGLRLAVLRGIEKDPAKALSYGSHEGRDVVDALIEMGRKGESSSALLAIQTLTCFAGPRVLDFFLERLRQGTGQVLQASAAYLMGRDFPREAAYEALLQDDLSLRPRAVARVLGPPRAEDPPDVALRLALLDPRCTLPGTAGGWADLWRAELQGVVVGEARAALEQLDAFAWCLEQWDGLSAANRQWLLRWGARSHPQACEMRLREALAEDPLSTMALLDRALELVRDALPVDHPDERIRQVAHRLAGPAPRSQEALVRDLEHEDWPVRARASEALVAMGSEVVAAVRPLVGSSRVEVRAAAVQTLLALGEEAWLEEALLVP